METHQGSRERNEDSYLLIREGLPNNVLAVGLLLMASEESAAVTWPVLLP